MGLILVIFSFLLLLSLLIVIYQELILTNVPVWRSPFFYRDDLEEGNIKAAEETKLSSSTFSTKGV